MLLELRPVRGRHGGVPASAAPGLAQIDMGQSHHQGDRMIAAMLLQHILKRFGAVAQRLWVGCLAIGQRMFGGHDHIGPRPQRQKIGLGHAARCRQPLGLGGANFGRKLVPHILAGQKPAAIQLGIARILVRAQIAHRDFQAFIGVQVGRKADRRGQGQRDGGLGFSKDHPGTKRPEASGEG